ncbi:uncharacterized protein PG986_013899 [Apiospora aurea]|uniref:Uncharacterized protein n=1 Tax=Apiospora aurea TaxID=335848 RepID=A0ABR1PWY2_9PEZI
MYATLYLNGIHQDIRYALVPASQFFDRLQKNPSALEEGTDESLRDFVELWLRTAVHDMNVFIKSYNRAPDGRKHFNLWTWRQNFDPQHNEYKHRGSNAPLHKTSREVMSKASKERDQIKYCIQFLDEVLGHKPQAEENQNYFEAVLISTANNVWQTTNKESPYLPEDMPKKYINMADVTYLEKREVENLCRRLKSDVDIMRVSWCDGFAYQNIPLTCLSHELYNAWGL